MKKLNTFLGIAFLMLFSTCQLTELDLQENPNESNLEEVNIEKLFNKIQLDFNDFIISTWDFTASLTRMDHEADGFTYIENYRPALLNKTWDLAYAKVLRDIELMLELSKEKPIKNYVAISKILKAYTLITLVDLFGEVPYSQSLKAEESNWSPNHDGGQFIYSEAERLLNEAILDLTEISEKIPDNDLYYDGDMSKWSTLAKTVKLKMALQTRLVNPNAKNKILDILEEGDIIDEASEDFQFNYSKVQSPDSRHPLYVSMYESPERESEFLSNYFMWLLKYEKIDENGNHFWDPRTRFYFNRQASFDNVDVSLLPCSIWAPTTPLHYLAIDENMPYCYIGDNYFGRDHLNGGGIPPNFPIRTVYGLYPMGGKFDENAFRHVDDALPIGAQGEGINPILLSSFVYFMRAEADFVLNTNEDSRDLLRDGIQASMDKVFSFQHLITKDLNRYDMDPAIGQPWTIYDAYFDGLEAHIPSYINFVLAKYESASPEEKLNIIIKEYFIALWGNGLEAYNNYRRTCMPLKMQPAIEPHAGAFVRSAPWPSNHVNLNENVEQKNIAQPVFWDVNEEGCVY